MLPYYDEMKQQLIDQGIYGDGVEDPDYIAGRYTDYESYMKHMEPGAFPWDPFQGAYVPWDEVTPGLVYDPDTLGYVIPRDFADVPDTPAGRNDRC